MTPETIVAALKLEDGTVVTKREFVGETVGQAFLDARKWGSAALKEQLRNDPKAYMDYTRKGKP
jgi:hypothetical protein